MAAIDLFLSGEYVKAIMYVYTSVFGPAEGALFYLLIWISIFGVLYISAQDITLPAIISLLFGFSLIAGGFFSPEAHRIGYFILVFAVASLLFKIRSVRTSDIQS